jgi:hypothetical protein
MSLAFVLAFYNILLMFGRKRKIWLLPVLVVIGSFLIVTAARIPILDKYYGVENPHSYQELFSEAYEEGYRDGYKKAIEEAQLITVMNNGRYIIDFNGNSHVYSCNITDVNN